MLNSMDLERIRRENVKAVNRLGGDVLLTLPLLEEDSRMRGSDEAMQRLLAMHAVAAVAYGFDKNKAVAWLEQEKLADALSESEGRFMSQGVGEPERFRVQVEGEWALAWAMGIVGKLDFAEACDDRFVTWLPNLKQNQSARAFVAKAAPRSLKQVVSACDLAYCLHWALRQAELVGFPSTTRLAPCVVIERRRALEWLLSREPWDDIVLDT